jgi:hypothetical protein
VPERLLWLLASAAGVALLVAALWPSAVERKVPEPDRPAPSAAPVRLQAPIRIAVLNGCGEGQIAGRLTKRARALGLDVIHEGNAESFHYMHTLVVDRGGDLEKARQVAQVLGIDAWVQQVTEDPFRLEDVAVVIGRDYRRLSLFNP